MKKSFAVFALAAVFCLFLSSCDGVPFKSVNELLAPPLYYSEYGDLVESFKKELGSNIVFCTPYGGEHCSAITLEDIDGNGSDEAIVFYRQPTPDAIPKACIFSESGKSWTARAELDGYGSGVDSLSVSDLDGDGTSELIVNWNASGSAGKTMSVYRSEKGGMNYSEITNELNFVSCIADADSDGKNEILFIGQSVVGGSTQRTAKLLKISDGSVVIEGEAGVDPNVTGYGGIKTEKVSENSPMKFYIDAAKSDVQMITELIFWDGENAVLRSPFCDSETSENTATLRYEPIASADINNDGSIEIPVQSEIQTDERPNIDSENVRLTTWIDYDGEKVRAVADTFISQKDGYMFFLDENEKDEIRAKSFPARSCIILSDANGDICSVLNVSKKEIEDNSFERYISVIENEDSVICAYITQNGESRGLTENTVRQKITAIPK